MGAERILMGRETSCRLRRTSCQGSWSGIHGVLLEAAPFCSWPPNLAPRGSMEPWLQDGSSAHPYAQEHPVCPGLNACVSSKSVC